MIENLYERIDMLDQPEPDYADELLGTVHALRSAGVTRRGISEMLNIHEQQVRQLLENPYTLN